MKEERKILQIIVRMFGLFMPLAVPFTWSRATFKEFWQLPKSAWSEREFLRSSNSSLETFSSLDRSCCCSNCDLN
jgi:hypothetical protein